MNSIYASEVTTINIVATAFFLFAWFIYGFYSGNKKSEHFIIINLVFWSINIVTTLIQFFIGKFFMYILPIYFSYVPMYGLLYFINHKNIMAPFSYCLLILTIVLVSTIGYIIGLIFNKLAMLDNIENKRI